MNNTRPTGLGLSSVLTVIFVVLKLIGTIDWSWWWVLSPLWIDFCIVMLVSLGCGIYLASKKKKMAKSWAKRKSDMMDGTIRHREG